VAHPVVHDEVADGAGAQQLPQHADGRAVAELLQDKKLRVALPGSDDQCARLVEGARHGLLDHHVLARLERRQRHGRVQWDGREHDHDVDVGLANEFMVVGEKGGAGIVAGHLLPAGLTGGAKGDQGDPVGHAVQHAIYDAARHSTRGYGTTAWRIHPDFPLGTLFDGGHHSIAQLSRLFGRPQAVTASGVQLRPEYGQYDQVLMLFEYASGLRGVFSHSDSLGGGRNYFHVRGKQGVATVERQRVVVTNNEGNEVRTVDLDDADTYGAMWRELVDCVQQGRTPSYTMEDALDDLATLLAVARSVEEGTRVEVAP